TNSMPPHLAAEASPYPRSARQTWPSTPQRMCRFAHPDARRPWPCPSCPCSLASRQDVNHLFRLHFPAGEPLLCSRWLRPSVGERINRVKVNLFTVGWLDERALRQQVAPASPAASALTVTTHAPRSSHLHNVF